MLTKYSAITNALEALSAAVESSTSERRSLLEMHGWNFPAADAYDFSFMVKGVLRLVHDRAPETALISAEDDIDVSAFVARVKAIESTVPYLFNGNGQVAAPAFAISIQALEAWVEEKWPEKELLDPNSLPSKLARQARAAKSRLDVAVNGLVDIETRLSVIADAHQAAENLPADLEDLKQARTTLVSINGQSSADAAVIKEARAEVESLVKAIRQARNDADALVENCEEAYRITTTKGLAGAFEQRATSLAISMWVWVGGLFFSLVSVAAIGHNRIGALTDVLAGDPKWGTVTLNFLLSAISVGAPLWFAWVATKQIGQRFRLSEDYGFKASVAKAYEGYRKQAVQIDPKFEAQLFGIALSRLEEQPLRMVEPDNHGSPWHEILARRRKHEAVGVPNPPTAVPATTGTQSSTESVAVA